jgi:cell division protein FtsQ
MKRNRRVSPIRKKKQRENRKRRDFKALFMGWSKGLGQRLSERSNSVGNRMARALPYVVVALMATTLPLLVIHGYSFVMRSPNFSVKHVIVEGQKRLPIAEVMAHAGVLRGPNVLALDLNLVAERLMKHPWIETATVTRELPDRLVIAVKEREGVAQLALGALYLVDRRGEVFKRVDAGESFEWPVFTGLIREDLEEGVSTERATTVKRLIRGGISLLETWKRNDRSNIMPIGDLHLDPLFGYSVTLAGNASHGAGAMVHMGYGDLASKMRKLAVILADAKRRGRSIASVRLDDEREPGRVAVKYRGVEQSVFESGDFEESGKSMASGETRSSSLRPESL